MNRRTALLIAAVAVLSVQAIYSRILTRDPFLPSPPPMSSFPARLGDWIEIREEMVPPDSLEVLGPDDAVARVYQNPANGSQAELFVAYYKTQLRPKNAHDPKVCLPGSGWNPIASHSLALQVNSRPLPVNYYRIRKDERERVVLYWFQTFHDVYTREQQLKAHRMLDAVFENRTDMALVRLIVPVTPAGVPAADAKAAELAPVVYNQMLRYFPPTRNANPC